jgi:hypothetical protein
MTLPSRVRIAAMMLILFSTLNIVPDASELWMRVAGWVLIMAAGAVIAREVVRARPRQDMRGEG